MKYTIITQSTVQLRKLGLVLILAILCMADASAQRGKAKVGGGATRKAAAPAKNVPSNNRAAVSRPTPAANNNRDRAVDRGSNNGRDRGIGQNDNRGGNRDINAGNKTNVGNRVNVDKSKTNVNINVDNSKKYRVNNSRNTTVRRHNHYRPYSRPPYRYGGYRYNCYHPYYYHPYRPYVWGPRWHPWGFFVATLATTAIILSVQNEPDVVPGYDMAQAPVFDNSYYPANTGAAVPVIAAKYNMPGTPATLVATKEEYYYDEGVYYIKADGGYTVVAAPVGATIKSLPDGYETVEVDESTKNYYYGGAFYEKTSGGYTVVPPTAGTIVERISEGGEEVKMGDVTYVKMGDTYFQPIDKDGKKVYEVADVEEDK
jgi:hypothetical protein